MKIDWDLILQMISISGTAGVMLVFWEIMLQMKFSFYQAIVNLFKYIFYAIFFRRRDSRYLEPIDWLTDNAGYLGVPMIIFGHLVSLISQVVQVRTGSYHTKLPTFFLSSPLNNYGLILFVMNPVIQFIKKRMISFRYTDK